MVEERNDGGLSLREMRALLAYVGSRVEPVVEDMLVNSLHRMSSDSMKFTARHGFIIDCHVLPGVRVRQADLDRMVQILRKQHGRYYRSGKVSVKA